MEERLLAIELLILLIAMLEVVLVDELLFGLELLMLLAAILELGTLDLARLLTGLPMLLLFVLIRLFWLLCTLCGLLLFTGALETELLLRSDCMLTEELLILRAAELREFNCDLAEELETKAVADDDSDALLPGRLSVAVSGIAVLAPEPPPQALNSSENSTAIHPLCLGYKSVINVSRRHYCYQWPSLSARWHEIVN